MGTTSTLGALAADTVRCRKPLGTRNQRLRLEVAFVVEICSEMLQANRLAVEVAEVVRAIQERANGDLSVMYGYGCADEEKNQWKWISVPVAKLSEFLAASAQRGIYEQGSADLHISVPCLAVEVTLCHESDIHIKGETNEFLDYFRLRWLRQGITAWWRSDDNAQWQKALLPN